MQESQSVSTRFGVLSVRKDRILVFKGRPLRPSVRGNNSLVLGSSYRIGATDVILVTDNGGTACPFQYYLVTLSNSGAKATPAFGTCAELMTIQRTGSALSIHMPGYRGPFEPERDRLKAARERHVFVFRHGAIVQDGKPVR
jgi:hypothetical protein